MSKYLPAVECSAEFEGDTVTYSVEPLENIDFAELLPFFKENKLGETVLRFEDQGRFLTVAGGLLKKYAKNFSGLTDARGEAIPLETATSRAYFMELVSKMMMDLFQASMVDKEEEKNSVGPSVQG